MSEPAIDTQEALRDWFVRSGVAGPLQSCIGPLPQSKAAIVRWSSETPDTRIQTTGEHANNYRIAIMLEPLDSEIWNGERPIWRGVIGANRFRICPPGPSGRRRHMSGCDIVNLFIPTATVDALGLLRGADGDCTLAETLFTPDRQVLDLVKKMLDAPTLAGPLAPQLCDGLVTALVAYLLEHYTKPAAGCKASSLAGARLRRVLAHIAERLAEDVPIAELAQSCAMSESHFSREFHKAVGLPPHQYLLKLRMERAATALLEGDARVIDIACELGFNNVSHFSRAFATRFGVAPTVYRRERVAA